MNTEHISELMIDTLERTVCDIIKISHVTQFTTETIDSVILELEIIKDNRLTHNLDIAYIDLCIDRLKAIIKAIWDKQNESFIKAEF